MKMKEMPEAERPYEKLELYGEKALSNAELLAIIIKTGTKEETSLQIAQRVLKLNDQQDETGLSFLKKRSLKELMQIKGIGRVKAIELKAVSEIVTRMQKPANYKKLKFIDNNQVGEILLQEFRFETREIVKVYLLNSHNMVIREIDIATGGANYAGVSIAEIIGLAVQERAVKILLAHNHPSGCSMPSKQDIKFTDELYNAAHLLGIDVIDHIVVGDMEYTSIYQVLKTKIAQVKKAQAEKTERIERK